MYTTYGYSGCVRDTWMVYMFKYTLQLARQLAIAVSPLHATTEPCGPLAIQIKHARLHLDVRYLRYSASVYGVIRSGKKISPLILRGLHERYSVNTHCIIISLSVFFSYT